MRKFLTGVVLVAVLVSLFAVSSGPAAAADAFKLTILHTSENHGHWDVQEYSKVSQGGIARRATLVKQLRGQIPNTLLLDSGDISQGTLYFTQFKSAEGRDFYNMLGYDAVVTGNHEFDLGPKVLADNFVTGANFSIVLANVDLSAEPSLAGKVPPFVIKTVAGEKIGIFGMVTDDLPINSNAGPNVKMKDAVATAKDMVAQLTAQGVNKIILLSHRGFNNDFDLAGKVDGIDVIVSGHTQTLMGNAPTLDPSLGVPDAPYPVVASSPNGGRTVIAHDFIWGRLLGRLDLGFDDKGEVTSWGGAPILVGKDIADDAAVAAKLATFAKPLEDLRKQIVGKTTVDLDSSENVVRRKEAALGDLVADSMLWATQQDKTQVAITNGGGLRAPIKAGDISIGDILTVLPFGNRLVQFDLVGADVLSALENGVSRMTDPDPAGRFPQVSGIKFAVDAAKPANSRVSDAQVGNDKDGFKPLDKAATYRIVTNDFMATGGDGYSVFTRGRNVRGGDVPLDQALADYLKANPSVSPTGQGRIVISNAPQITGSGAQPGATGTVTGTVSATKTATATVSATITVTGTVSATTTVTATAAVTSTAAATTAATATSAATVAATSLVTTTTAVTSTVAATATRVVTATVAATTAAATTAAVTSTVGATTTPGALPTTGGDTGTAVLLALTGLLLLSGAVMLARARRA